MVRPVINLSNRATETEIKTLKLSYDNQSNIHAPLVWEKPSAAVYDYHYEIDGLYYQPMINYCIERASGARRKVVDIPDRLLSNYDKRSYRLANTEVDYEDFLTQSYQRRMKDVNSKKIHCANEMVSRSKKNTELGMARGSAMMRDKYLNQLQMMYTEKLAREGNVNFKGVVEKSGDERRRRSLSLEVLDKEPRRGENRILARKRNDARYGPAYERITVLDSERYNKGEDVQFIPTGRAVSEEREMERAEMNESYSKMEQSSSSKMVKVIQRSSSGEQFFEESFEDMKIGEGNRRSFINKEYLNVENMNEFNRVRLNDLAKKEKVVSPTEVAIYQDCTYSKAIKDVQNRVKKEGSKYLLNQKNIDDIKCHYRGRTIEQVGNVERALIRSTMYNVSKIPNFDVGYDVV